MEGDAYGEDHTERKTENVKRKTENGETENGELRTENEQRTNGDTMCRGSHA
jgi:hypothetical protein